MSLCGFVTVAETLALVHILIILDHFECAGCGDCGPNPPLMTPTCAHHHCHHPATPIPTQPILPEEQGSIQLCSRRLGTPFPEMLVQMFIM